MLFVLIKIRYFSLYFIKNYYLHDKIRKTLRMVRKGFKCNF